MLRLGSQLIVDERSPGTVGWGAPSWGVMASRGFMGQRLRPGMLPSSAMKPRKVGARYFCGDCDSKKENEPVVAGNKWTGTKSAYQEAVTLHYTANHPDLHYPIDQGGLDAMLKAKAKAAAVLRMNADLKDLKKWEDSIGGGVDVSGFFRPVTRPRELPDLTEFDFPDANVADAAAEEIELDQLISIAAREGRRLLGIELQQLDSEFAAEFATAPDNADLTIAATLQLNSRTGLHNLDDPENLWRAQYTTVVANVEATAGTGAAIVGQFEGLNEVIPGGVVYVAPRLFFRFDNDMDRQVDTGDLFTRIATIRQRLTTFLLFELLEQYSGLFGLT